MIIFTNNKTTNFCPITLRIKRIIHKRQVVPFFLPDGVHIVGCREHGEVVCCCNEVTTRCGWSISDGTSKRSDALLCPVMNCTAHASSRSNQQQHTLYTMHAR